MTRRKSAQWYEVVDDFSERRRAVWVVRYDGDRPTWDRLVAEILHRHSLDPDDVLVEKPKLRWYRMSPDLTVGRYLKETAGPGPGSFRGAKVVWRRLDEAIDRYTEETKDQP